MAAWFSNGEPGFYLGRRKRPGNQQSARRRIGIIYRDQWTCTDIAVHQMGQLVTVSSPSGEWGPNTGTIEGDRILIFGKAGTLHESVIEWDNGAVWTRRRKVSHFIPPGRHPGGQRVGVAIHMSSGLAQDGPSLTTFTSAQLLCCTAPWRWT